MKVELNFDRAIAHLEDLAPEFASDPRGEEDFDARDFDMYEEVGGRFVLDEGRRAAMLGVFRTARVQAENERLRDERNRQTVIDELRRNLRASRVKPGLIDAAIALFLAQHRFAIDDSGKVFVLDGQGTMSDALAASVRWIERDEQGDLKGRSAPTGEDGEFSRMAAMLRN